jgi:hypothetical protein
MKIDKSIVGDGINITFWIAGFISLFIVPALTAVFWAYPAGWTAGEVFGRRYGEYKKYKNKTKFKGIK